MSLGELTTCCIWSWCVERGCLKKMRISETAERVRAFIGRDTSAVVSHGTRNRGTGMDEDGRVRWRSFEMIVVSRRMFHQISHPFDQLRLTNMDLDDVGAVTEATMPLRRVPRYSPRPGFASSKASFCVKRCPRLWVIHVRWCCGHSPVD